MCFHSELNCCSCCVCCFTVVQFVFCDFCACFCEFFMLNLRLYCSFVKYCLVLYGLVMYESLYGCIILLRIM
jgi:hypothetical protein